jgi:sugar lactone lactonase YvrE
MADSQGLQQWHVSAPYLETHCSLGEGPYYEPATNTLRFVDIIKKQLHTVSLTTEGTDTSSLKTLQFDEAITVTADIDGRDPQETLLVGAKQGLAVLDRKTGKYEYVTKFEDEKAERIRSNDGVVDPNGGFWLGTMTDFGRGPFQPEGEFSLFIFFLVFSSSLSLLPFFFAVLCPVLCCPECP